ncbi:peroxiredoxin [Maricaulis sp. D1M11]|uniref:peroxiredoxin n=1 Tax=Maricaulis sp. D1M11 TaxID=3076117 RepID=UPI0039B46D4C
MSELKIGDPAPDFTLPTDGDGSIQLADLAGRNVVLFFYPKDDTPGCTTESIGFSEAIESFGAENTTVIGVSKDTVAKHDKFKAKHDLKVILGSDAETDMIERYGAWVLKKMYGREYMGIERSTFLIGADGKIAQIWRKVRVKGHVDAVLEATQTLNASS